MHYINRIRNSMQMLPGIIRTDVNPQGKQVTVIYEDDQVSMGEIEGRIEAVGCRVG